MSSSRGFASGVLAGALACALVLFVPVILVDPTTYLGSRWPGKPQVCDRGIRVEARVGKPLALAVVRPQEVLLGNSRVADGFNERTTMQQVSASVMNLGIPGATLEELEIMLAAALRSGALQRIWLGVDYGMFEQDRLPSMKELNTSSFARLRTAVANPDAISTSYAALLGGSCSSPDTTVRGFARTNRYLKRAGVLGWSQLITLSKIKMERAFAEIAHAEPRKRAALAEARRSTLLRMLRRAQEAKVTVVLFVGPAHPQHFDAIRHAGLEDDFRQWRRDLQALGKQVGTPVFDFSDYTVAPTGDFSSCGQASEVRCSLMYDVNHYKPAVGAHMLNVMLESPDTRAAWRQTAALH